MKVSAGTHNPHLPQTDRQTDSQPHSLPQPPFPECKKYCEKSKKCHNPFPVWSTQGMACARESFRSISDNPRTVWLCMSVCVCMRIPSPHPRPCECPLAIMNTRHKQAADSVWGCLSPSSSQPGRQAVRGRPQYGMIALWWRSLLLSQSVLA